PLAGRPNPYRRGGYTRARSKFIVDISSRVEMSQTLSSMQPGCKSRLTRPPFFLIGSVRSGTTMLRLMLDHHPQLACHFEFEYAIEKMTSSGQVPDADQYREYLRQNRIFKLSKFKIDESLSYRELVESFLIQKQKLDSKSIVGATI